MRVKNLHFVFYCFELSLYAPMLFHTSGRQFDNTSLTYGNLTLFLKVTLNGVFQIKFELMPDFNDVFAQQQSHGNACALCPKR